MVTAKVRCRSVRVVPFNYPDGYCQGQQVFKAGEAVELRASGVLDDLGVLDGISRAIAGGTLHGGVLAADSPQFPISVHIQVPPGHPLIPYLGDHLRVRIDRES